MGCVSCGGDRGGLIVSVCRRIVSYLISVRGVGDVVCVPVFVIKFFLCRGGVGMLDTERVCGGVIRGKGLFRVVFVDRVMCLAEGSGGYVRSTGGCLL